MNEKEILEMEGWKLKEMVENELSGEIKEFLSPEESESYFTSKKIVVYFEDLVVERAKALRKRCLELMEQIEDTEDCETLDDNSRDIMHSLAYDLGLSYNSSDNEFWESSDC